MTIKYLFFISRHRKKKLEINFLLAASSSDKNPERKWNYQKKVLKLPFGFNMQVLHGKCGKARPYEKLKGYNAN